VQNTLKQDPFSGHMFLFINKKRNAIKCLCYDGTGLILLCKRLEKGTFFKINPLHKKEIVMTQAEFSLYIDGGDINRRFLDSPREMKKK
jgi:transposase